MKDVDPKEMLVATISAISVMMSQLSKSGGLDVGAVIEEMQRTAAAHRATGHPEKADAIFALSEYFLSSVPAQSDLREPRQP